MYKEMNLVRSCCDTSGLGAGQVQYGTTKFLSSLITLFFNFHFLFFRHSLFLFLPFLVFLPLFSFSSSFMLKKVEVLCGR